MRTLKGTCHNISSPLLVKIVSEAYVNENEPQAFLFIYENELKKQGTGLILQRESSIRSFRDYTIVRIENENHLLVGDLLLIEPSGTCTVLFEQASDNNVLFLTERCDSMCLTCPQPPRNDTEDLVDLALRIISLLDEDTVALGITGGEPTLVWEGLMRTLSMCQKFLPRTHLQLLTNARSLNDYNKVKELAEVAGDRLLTCVTVYGDVDFLHDKIAGIPGAFWETLEGIYNLARANIPVEIRAVITQLNYKRLPQWADFVYRSFPFATHIALMGLEPIGQAHKNLDILWVDTLDYQQELQEAVRILNRRGMCVSIYNHQLCVLPNRLWPFAKRAISEWKVIHLSECEDCEQTQACGGFFSSARHHHSRGITPIKIAYV